MSETQVEAKKPYRPYAPRNLTGSDKTMIIIAWILQFSMLGLGIYLWLTGDTTWLVACVMAFVITLIPFLIARSVRVVTPIWLLIWIVFALFLHTMGGVLGFYDTVPAWDHITHAVSSSLIAALGFLMVAAIDAYMVSVYFPRQFLALFVFVFGLAIGIFWEILEFANDEIAGTNLQYELEDTMWDLWWDALASLFVGIFVLYYTKTHPADTMIKGIGIDNLKDLRKKKTPEESAQ